MGNADPPGPLRDSESGFRYRSCATQAFFHLFFSFFFAKTAKKDLQVCAKVPPMFLDFNLLQYCRNVTVAPSNLSRSRKTAGVSCDSLIKVARALRQLRCQRQRKSVGDRVTQHIRGSVSWRRSAFGREWGHPSEKWVPGRSTLLCAPVALSFEMTKRRSSPPRGKGKKWIEEW